MKPYLFLPHTADTKFQAFGKTLEEAFQNAAYALTDVMTDHLKVKPNTEKTIKIESESEESLLYDFLEQFLILLDSKSFLLHKIKDLKITEQKKITEQNKTKKLKLTAKLLGDTHPENYEIITSIKAITYQEMFIKKEAGKVTIQVVPDI